MVDNKGKYETDCKCTQTWSMQRLVFRFDCLDVKVGTKYSYPSHFVSLLRVLAICEIALLTVSLQLSSFAQGVLCYLLVFCVCVYAHV